MNPFHDTKAGSLSGKLHPKNQLNFSRKNLPYLLLDAVPSGILYIHNDYTYHYANKTYADWFGISPTDIVGRSIKDF